MAGDETLSTSVIVPCYNGASYLGEAIESILDQDHRPDEIIVVDDGSAEPGTAEAARRFGSRVRYQYQPHQGIGAARNRGVRSARSACVAFLDADDLWPPASLGVRLARLAASPRIDCVYGLAEQFLCSRIDAATRERLHCPTGAQPARSAGAMLVRRNVFDRIGFFDASLKLGETIDWVARFEDHGLSAVAVDEIVLRRRIHGTNTSIREKDRRSDYLRILKASIDRRRRRQTGDPSNGAELGS